MDKISEITRRDIVDIIKSGFSVAVSYTHLNKELQKNNREKPMNFSIGKMLCKPRLII